MIEFRYRPDVDGLRAIAVILVLLFHADLGFPGGFVGVDVFFVISGFLITGLILKENQRGKFSLKAFWIRRIRRILPASAIVVIISLAFGAILLLPSDFETLSISAFYQQLMLSNVFFWLNTGYFDGPSDLNPLLHTWSLAVEEQFYLFYPILLVSMARFSERAILPFLLLLMFASLALSEFGVRSYQNATFYLLPTRAWELLLGGALCFAPTPKPLHLRHLTAIGVLGIGGILFASLTFDSSTQFPGVAALVPCLGTAFVIFSNSKEQTLVGDALSSKPFLGIGLISYSLYLWHWPILSFAKLVMLEPPSRIHNSVALFASFIIGYLSWRFVEQPFRKAVLAPQTRGLILIALGSMLLITGFAFTIGKYDGFPSRLPPTVLAYRKSANSAKFIEEVEKQKVSRGELPSFGAKAGEIRCLAWGDSHAMSLMPAIDKACKNLGIRGYQATHSSTPPVLDLVYAPTKFGLDDRAPAWNESVVEFARHEEIDLVVIAAYWRTYESSPNFELKLNQTVERLTRTGIRVVLVRDIPHQHIDVPRLLAKTSFAGGDVTKIGVELDKHRLENSGVDEVLDQLPQSQLLSVIDPAAYFVDERRICRAEFNGIALYRDSHHLSVEGALRLTPLFAQVFTDHLKNAHP